MKTLFAFLFFIGISTSIISQDNMSRQDYIEKYKTIAISEMQNTGIPASITLAQGLLESGNGNSDLARKAKNHFGIKCHAGWEGKGYYMDDDAKDECFRVYKNPEESFKDHSDFLVGRERYAFLFDYKPTDYKSWAKGLKKAGYATNPRYPELLIKIIEDEKLYELDSNKKEKSKKRHESNSKEAVVITKEKAKTQNHISSNVRVKLHDNYIKYIISKEGETYQSIANELEMMEWQLYKYNDINRSEKSPKPGEVIFLQPKRNRAKTKTHVVKAGETMRSISQKYGIKLKKLYKRSSIPFGTEPKVGQKVKMR